MMVPRDPDRHKPLPQPSLPTTTSEFYSMLDLPHLHATSTSSVTVFQALLLRLL